MVCLMLNQTEKPDKIRHRASDLAIIVVQQDLTPEIFRMLKQKSEARCW